MGVVGRRSGVSGGCPMVERAGGVDSSLADSTTSECCWWVDGGGSPGGRIPAECDPEVRNDVAGDGECNVPGGGIPVAVASGIDVKMGVVGRRCGVSSGCPTVKVIDDVYGSPAEGVAGRERFVVAWRPMSFA